MQNSQALEAKVTFLFIHHLQNWLSKECNLKKLEASSMLMMIYPEEGKLELVTNNADMHDENLVPKLHISGKLYQKVLHSYMCTSCAGLLYKKVRKGTQENKEREIKTQLTIHSNLLSETGLVVNEIYYWGDCS